MRCRWAAAVERGEFRRAVRMLLHPIGNDRQAERRKRGIAVGFEAGIALRLELATRANRDANFAGLVAAADPTRQTAREYHPRYVESFNHRGRLLACGEPAHKAPTQHAPVGQKIGCFVERNERRRR